VRNRRFWGRDGAGQEIIPESVRKAVASWAEPWRNALFDCGPQDYYFIVKEIIKTFELVYELEDRLDLPEVQRRRNEATVPFPEVKKELDLPHNTFAAGSVRKDSSRSECTIAG
jgi:hypothetical protein